MGRALVRDPSVFLLDEPLSNLDARLRAQIRAEIAQIQKRFGITTLYVTHDQVEAMTLGDRVVVLDRGEIQQVGTPQALYDRPQNIHVAGFIGSPGMNILCAGLADKGGAQIAIKLGKEQISLSVEPQAYSRLARHSGQEVHIGIRPEAFNSVKAGTGIQLTTKVEAVEFLGHETLVYFSLPGVGQACGDRPLIARLPGQYPEPTDETALFYIGPDALYFFDRAGVNILG
jgi:multiple sugar transport system ATP-binding protein